MPNYVFLQFLSVSFSSAFEDATDEIHSIFLCLRLDFEHNIHMAKELTFGSLHSHGDLFKLDCYL